jgi:hypothetical protein
MPMKSRNPRWVLPDSLGAAVPIALRCGPPSGLARASTTYCNDAPAGCSPGTVGCPSSDRFYSPPAHLGPLSDGAPIRVRRAVIAESGIGNVEAAYAISFRSEDAFGAPVTHTAAVFLPTASYSGVGRRPLGRLRFAGERLGAQCQPSYALALPTIEGPDGSSICGRVDG